MARRSLTRTRVSLLATTLVAGLVVAVPVAISDSSTSANAGGQSTAQSKPKALASETPSARAASPRPTLKVSRKTTRSSPRLVVNGLDGTVKVTARYRVKRGAKGTVTRVSTKQRKISTRASWALVVHPTTYRLTVQAPGVHSLTRAVPAKRFSRTFALKMRTPNLATDFTRFGTAATFWDTCSYMVSAGTTTVSSVIPSNTMYYGGNVNGKFASHVKFALNRVAEVTGFRFEYASQPKDFNYLEFVIKDNSKKGTKNKWELSGVAGPGWVNYDSGKSRYTGADISLNLMNQAPTNAIRRLIMHEVGHAMGLSHAKYETQVMYSQVFAMAPVWGNGDRAGLKQVANRGCRFQVGDDLS